MFLSFYLVKICYYFSGVLDGFSFDMDDDGDRDPRSTANKGTQGEKSEDHPEEANRRKPGRTSVTGITVPLISICFESNKVTSFDRDLFAGKQAQEGYDCCKTAEKNSEKGSNLEESKELEEVNSIYQLPVFRNVIEFFDRPESE